MKPIQKNNAQILLSFDDFDPTNLRVAELLLKYNLPATFFIETMTDGALEQIKKLSEMGFEIGGHTMTHPGDIKLLNAEEVRTEILTCKLQIEKATGKECVSFAYPRGRFNDDTVEIVKMAGFKDARTTHVLKTESLDPFRSPTTVHVFNGRKEYAGRTWAQIAEFYLDHVLRKGGVFHLWGHGWEIDRDGQWQNLEEFLKKISAL